MKNSDSKNKDLCAGCSMCCRYVCVEIDTPTTKTDYDEIMWMLIHKDIWVYIDDEDGDWYVQFNTPCEALDDEHLCKIYRNRPNVCRKHTQDSCEKYGEGEYYKKMFKTREEFLEWLKQNKKDYNFKHFEH